MALSKNHSAKHWEINQRRTYVVEIIRTVELSDDAWSSVCLSCTLDMVTLGQKQVSLIITGELIYKNGKRKRKNF